MDSTFWHQRWESNQIAFHESRPNSLLVNHFTSLGLDPGSRIFLPLCGKTLDIDWLLSQGYQVTGIELSNLAINQLFKRLSINPKVTQKDNLTHYSATNIDLFAGDFFDLDQRILGTTTVVYDRAALVALPQDMRRLYTKKLIEITPGAAQFLITFDYDQKQMQGPPFSISHNEILGHYQDSFVIKQLAGIDVPNGLKGICHAMEYAWYLKPRQSWAG